ncbi:MAG TPA: aminoglycoside phosphotransferase family protein [Nocardioidaceae bacterium]|nr:aminoglycoside phosphotransferase family protein [Nocardioidaceae bacterium]
MVLAVEPPGLGVSGAAPRAVGVRRTYAEIPDGVRSWVNDVLGSPVVSVEEQVGGMSPGCATRVIAADGSRAFVKAVGPELNPLTPDMFRNEIRVLSHLHDHQLWPRLVAAYDEPGEWVALLLEDVPGRHADTTRPDDVERVLESVGTLGEELAGLGSGLGLPLCRERIVRWGELWPAVDGLPPDVLPAWVGSNAGALNTAYDGLLEHAEGDHVVHGDLRNDNIIVRHGGRDGEVVFVDWAAACTGPAWYDPLLLCLEWVEHPVFDDLIQTFPAVRDLGDENVTAFLVAVGGWLAYRSTVAIDVNLPTLNDFRRQESARLLEGARRRLGLPVDEVVRSI